MGNEMGNSNTSGLQEEENINTRVQEASVQEVGHADGTKVEDQNVPEAQRKDYHGKENGLDSDVPNGAADSHVVNQIPDGNENEETEVHPLAESPEVEVKSISGGGGECSEVRTNSLSNDSNDHEKPPGNADGAEGENHVVPVAESEAYHEKEINGLSSDVPKEAGDPYIVNRISDEREQETEVLAISESPTFEVKTNNEAGSEISVSQPTSPSKHSNDLEIQQESNVTENLPQISDQRLEKQTSIKKGDEGTNISTSETISSPHDIEPQDFKDLKFDQPELAKIHADPPIRDSNGSLLFHEDTSGSNLNCTSDENGNAVSTMISKYLDATVVSSSNPEGKMEKSGEAVKEISEEEVSCDDRLEIKDGDEVGNGLCEKPLIKSNFLSGEGIKCNGGIQTEKSPISTDSTKAESEVTSMDESVNTHIEVFESIDNCVVLAAGTTLTEKESENGENKPGGYSTQSDKESVRESKADGENVLQSELTIETEGENNRKTIDGITCCGGNNDYIEEAKVAKNSHLVDGHIDDQNESSVESCRDSQKEDEMVPESGIVSTESYLTDCKREELSEERQILEEIEEKTNASNGTEKTEGRESGEQCLSAVEQEEVSLPKAPLSHVQPKDKQKNNEMQLKNIQGSIDSMSKLKPESNGDFLVTEASSFDSKNLMAEASVSVAELAIEKPEQDLSLHTAKTMMVAAEVNSQVNNVREQCAKVEMPAFASDEYLVQESVGRLSTESNSNYSNTQAQMQKSPSFGLDLRIEARTEKSDRTPLLCQDKTATEDFSGEQEVGLSSPIAHTHYDQDKLQNQAMEEKVVRMERSDSEKLKTPFLGFLKEGEEAHIINTQQKHDNINAAAKKANKESLDLHTNEVTATTKEKRKPRSSLFTTCMCCTAVIN